MKIPVKKFDYVYDFETIVLKEGKRHGAPITCIGSTLCSDSIDTLSNSLLLGTS